MVWKVYGGMRYFGSLTEHQISRFRRILENREKLLQLGLTTPDKPLDNYNEREWREHLEMFQECQYNILVRYVYLLLLLLF